MTERGEWRGIYTVLQETPEFTDLPPEAQLLWFHLKLRLGAAGIDSVPALEYVLSEVTGYPPDTIRDGIEILSARGWIVLQRNVVWLRNGLKYEPSRNLSNKNHLKSIESHIQGLPKLQIVNDFAKYYDLPEPFPGACTESYHPDGTSIVPPITEYGIRNTDITTLGASGDAPRESGSESRKPDPWPAKPKKDESGNYAYPTPFEEAWKTYPRRDGSNPKLGAYRAFRARVKDGEDPEELVAAARHYLEHVKAREMDGTSFVQQASTFYGPSEPFREFVDGPGSAGEGDDPGSQFPEDSRALNDEEFEAMYGSGAPG